MKPRLLAVASHPIQYHVPLYRILAASERLDFRVAYCRSYGVVPTYDKQFGRQIQWDTNLIDGYDHVFLRNVSPVADTFNPLHAVNPGIVRHVLGWADVIWINGIMYPTNWIALAAAKLKRARSLVRCELVPSMLEGSGLRARAKRGYYRLAFRAIDGALPIGAMNRRAYEQLGIDGRRMRDAHYVVDMNRFAVAAEERAERRARRRASWGLSDDDVAVVYLGKLTPRKHPEILLALDRASGAERLAIVWVGAGEMETQLRRDAEGLSRIRAVFAGLANQSEVPDVLWGADVFVFPSENEPWGLVLNEAMAAGVPAVVSDQIGAAPDLCVDGITGFLVPACDEDAFVRAVSTLAADASLRERMGRAALEHISTWTPMAAARGVEDAAVAAVNGWGGRE